MYKVPSYVGFFSPFSCRIKKRAINGTVNICIFCVIPYPLVLAVGCLTVLPRVRSLIWSISIRMFSP